MEDNSGLGDFRADKRLLLLCAFALAIGAISSVVALVLLRLIALITNIAFYHHFSLEGRTIEDHSLSWLVIFVPVVGALIIGLIARYGSEKIRGHGIPEALEAILLGQSRLSPKVAILKPLSSAISIGTGGPFGAEGPIIMTGGAFGSLFAQLFHVTAAERKVLLVAGAAAGMSAVFATPIAAILFAVELLLFEWKPRSFVPVAIASITASVLRVPLLGAGPVFPVTPHGPPSGELLVLAAIVGIVGGLGSAGLTKLVYTCEDLFERLPIHWMWWPAIGGLFVGLGGLLDPSVLGVGYDNISDLLGGKVAMKPALLLLAAKALVWAIALGSGTSGGVLAPLLIIGGSLGVLTGAGFSMGDSGLWATVGMAAMMGGTMRAPLTATLFSIELTRDFQLLSPLMLGSVFAMTVTVLLMKRSILTEKLARRGQHITREYAIDYFELMRVAEVMDKNPPTISSDMTVQELTSRIANGDPELCRRQGTLVMDEDRRLMGIVTRSDLVKALQQKRREAAVGEIASTDLVVGFPDESLQRALERMLQNGVGRLPIVKRNAPEELVGYLGRAAILSARMKMYREEKVREPGWLATAFDRMGSNP
jgi:CIC family chloride channel protein